MFKMHEVSQSADLYKEIRNKANMSGNYTARAEAETALASMGFPLWNFALLNVLDNEYTCGLISYDLLVFGWVLPLVSRVTQTYVYR